MEGSFKFPKLIRKQKKDQDLPRFVWEDIVKQKLGSGSFGSVYLAKHHGSPQNVVIKKLKSTLINSHT